MRRSRSLHPNKLPPILTKFVQLVFDRLSIKLAGQKFSLNSKRNDFVFPFIHICLKKLFLPNASGSYWPNAAVDVQDSISLRLKIGTLIIATIGDHGTPDCRVPSLLIFALLTHHSYRFNYVPCRTDRRAGSAL